MACNTFTIPPPHNGLRRSKSSKDLIKIRSTMRRSCSDNNIVSRPTRLKNIRSVGAITIFSTKKPSFVTNYSLRSLLSFDTEKETCGASDQDHELNDEDDDSDDKDVINKRANWVERIMELRTRWKSSREQEQKDGEIIDYEVSSVCDGCEVSYDFEEEDGEISKTLAMDREMFSRFLVRVGWSDVKMFSQLAFLCNIAYVIPDIKAKDLKRRFGLKFVTSSMERKTNANGDELEEESTTSNLSSSNSNNNSNNKRPCRASVAYGIAASAASYAQSVSEKGDEGPVAACVAASTMTSVVAAGERERSEAANDLRSIHSSPCEWFVCDDPITYTRCFVIQGSDSLASWQANLFFEPTKFEETECLVHRGIYEAAKGMYTQIMPEIMSHMSEHGKRAKIRFTGHSLGGSLSLLLHLMLLKRKVLKQSDLRPVVTFGSPFVFCGARKMLQELDVDESQIQCVVMHRDIVPRAFSCIYPNQVANLLRRLNQTFRSHPCLIQNKLLYSPIGKLLVLQPEESSSPPHPLLPQGCSLYALDTITTLGSNFSSTVLTTFLNNPHPLETLSDPTAYGSDGTILRDHDSSNYLKAVNGVLKRNNNENYANVMNNSVSVANNNNNNDNVLWPLLSSPSPRSWNRERVTIFG